MAVVSAPAGVPSRRLGTPRVLLLSLYWVALGYLWLPLGSQVLPIAIKNIVGNGLKGTGTAILEGVGTLIAVFWQPIMGSVSDRTNSRWGRRRPYIAVGTLGSVVFLLLMSGAVQAGAGSGSGLSVLLSGSFLWLLVLYFLLQVSENAAQAPYQGLLPDVVADEHERSRASAFVGVGNLVGLAVGFAVVGTLMGHSRPDLALVTMAAVLLISMLIVVLGFPDRVKPDPSLRAGSLEIVLGTFRIDRRRHSDFLWLMASRLTILVALAGLQRYAVFYFRDVFYPGPGKHLDELATLAGRDLQVVIVILAILVGFPAAELSYRVGRKPLIMASGILGILGTVGLIFSSRPLLPGFMVSLAANLLHVPPNLSQALYCGMLLGVAAGVFLAVDWAFMVDVIPAEEAGRFLGFSNIATAGSGVIAGFVGGFLIDIFNARGPILGQPGGYPATFAVYIASFILGTLAILKVRETRGRGLAAARPLGVGG